MKGFIRAEISNGQLRKRLVQSNAVTSYSNALTPEFNGQTLFELTTEQTAEFAATTERAAALLYVNGVAYWQPLAFSFVESAGKLYVSWAASITIETSDEIFLVRQ